MNLDQHAALANIKHVVAVREADFDFNRIAGLAFENLDTVFADLPAFGNDVRFNLVLVPGIEANVGVGSIDAKLGGVLDVVSFGSVIRLGGSQQQGDGEHGNGKMAHGRLSNTWRQTSIPGSQT